MDDASFEEIDPRPDLVLISIDTLRADHMGLYGYERNTTPTIDSLAAKGTRFDRAYATSSWTVPSVASMLSGRYPAYHGVVRGHLRKGVVLRQPVLPEDLVMVAELLSNAGYRTYGVANNAHLEARLGFARGFQHYACPGFADSASLEQHLEPWLAELGQPTPFFLWLHFFDPHAPYARAEPFFDRFWPAEAGSYPELARVKPAAKFDDANLTDEMRRHVVAQYDSEIARTDAALGRILARLPQRPRLVVLTADHGEEFLDHGQRGHGHTLYEELLRVPLIVVAPDSATQAYSDAPVGLIDVAPTLLAAAGATPPTDWPGFDLLGLDPEAAQHRILHFELSRGRSMRGAMRWPHKIVHEFDRNRALAFDLSADPTERRPLEGDWHGDFVELQAASNVAVRMARERRMYVRQRRLDPTRARQLEALGYSESATP